MSRWIRDYAQSLAQSVASQGIFRDGARFSLTAWSKAEDMIALGVFPQVGVGYVSAKSLASNKNLQICPAFCVFSCLGYRASKIPVGALGMTLSSPYPPTKVLSFALQYLSS